MEEKEILILSPYDNFEYALKAKSSTLKMALTTILTVLTVFLDTLRSGRYNLINSIILVVGSLKTDVGRSY